MTINQNLNFMYLQDIVNKCSVPEKFNYSLNDSIKSSSNCKTTLIVDFGSWQCRAGWCDEVEPSSKKKLYKTLYYIIYYYTV